MLILADDLTGALEVGCSFTQTGRSTGVYLQAGTKSTTEISVINTNTRNSPETVVHIYNALAKQLKEQSGFIYKKIDSTLRGHVQLELEQLYKHGFRQFLLAPAYPKLERVTLGGHQYVKGQKVTDSPAGNDPLSPATTSYLPNLVPSILKTETKIVSRLDKKYFDAEHSIVVDVETDNELQELASILLDANYQGVIVGSNGLADYLARNIGLQPQLKTPAISSLLIVSGSNHPTTHAQLDTLKNAAILASSQLQLLESPRGSTDARVVQKALKQKFINILKNNKPSSLMIIGGETAQTLLRALNVDVLLPLKELATGVPLSIIQGGTLEGTPLITKSGGFGNTDLLVTLLNHLSILETR